MKLSKLLIFGLVSCIIDSTRCNNKTKKSKKWVLGLFSFSLLFMFLISFVNGASITDNMVSYWKMDEISGTTFSDSLNNKNITLSNSYLGNGVGIINKGYKNSAKTYTARTSNAFTFGSADFTISTWFYNNVSGTDQMIMEKRISGDKGIQIFKYGGDNKLTASIDLGASIKNIPSTNIISLNQWYNIIYIRSGTNCYLYINNILNGTVASCNGDISGASELAIGSNYAGVLYYWNGKIDETGIWNKALNATERTIIYNGGLGKQYPFTSATPNSTITAKDIYSNTSITNFSINFNNTNYFTSDGTITLPILLSDFNLWNITFFNNSNYLNRTYTNYNFTASGNLEGELSSTNTTIIIKFYGTNITANVSNTNLTDWDYSISTITSNGIFNEPFTAGQNRDFQIKCNRQVFETRNFSLNITPQSSDTFIVYVNDTLNKLRFLDATNSSPINSATITIEYPSGETITRTTNTTGHIEFSYINSDDELDLGIYEITFTKSGYTSITISENINASNIPIDETYNISRTTINVNIYDRTTGNLLTENVSLYFLTLFNDTTATGTYSIANVSIIAGTYTIQALSTGYGTEQTTIIYTAEDNITINFYLLNLTDPNAGTLFINTLDEYNRRKTNVNVILSGYSPADLSYIDVSYCKSNANGECIFNIELNTKTYIVRGYILEGSSLFTAQLPEEILSVDNEVRNLVLFLDSSYIYSPEDFLIYNIDETYSNITNTSKIIIDFYKTNNLVSEMCLEYFRQYIGNLTSLTGNTYCLNSTSAIQYINGPLFILNTSNTYIARVTIDDILLAEFIYPANNTIEKILQDRSYISFIILLMWIVALGFCLHTKIVLFGVFAIALSWIELTLFPTYMILEFSVYKTIISIFVLWASRKKKETE